MPMAKSLRRLILVELEMVELVRQRTSWGVEEMGGRILATQCFIQAM
jgi:hypothetical protein